MICLYSHLLFSHLYIPPIYISQFISCYNRTLVRMQSSAINRFWMFENLFNIFRSYIKYFKEPILTSCEYTIWLFIEASNCNNIPFKISVIIPQRLITFLQIIYFDRIIHAYDDLSLIFRDLYFIWCWI